MVSESSLESNSQPFDLSSQAGIANLLGSLRESKIDAEQKNELRDLIFQYTSGGKESSVRMAIEQKINLYHLLPGTNFETKSSGPVQPEDELGRWRQAPDFPVPVVKKASVPEVSQNPPINDVVPTPVAVEAVPVKENIPVVQEVVNPVVEPVAVEPEVNVQTPITSPEPVAVEPEVNVPTPITSPEPVAVEPEVNVPTPVTSPIATENTSLPAENKSSVESEESLRRIREIKSAVNEKVGNPVNLVDINNEVGREYMTALLDAMKKVSNGSSARLEMQRLEKAYLMVEKVIEDNAKVSTSPLLTSNTEKTNPTNTPVSVEVPTSEVKTDSVSANPSETKLAKNPVSDADSSVQKVPVFRSELNVESQAPSTEVSKPILTAQDKVSSGDGAVKVAVNTPEKLNVTPSNTPEPASGEVAFLQEEIVSIPPEQRKTVESGKGGAVPTPEVAKKPVEKTQDVPKKDVSVPVVARSLADSGEKLKTPDVLDKNIPEITGPEPELFSPEVDDGLQQLLSEWVLFKKSGLFGTGPNGREHPLFKKISTLSVPLLLAGRFEGATQEIKQSVTDYMNGWRYEQGIIYNQGETFEHYLRRVIRHILDLQKGITH